MKARFKYNPSPLGVYCFEVCHAYPNCDCEGHYVWEEVKKTKGDGK